MAVETPTGIVQEITINAPAAKVFAAITEPKQLLQWWGSPETYRCTTMEADVRVGGRWRTAGEGADGESFSVVGTYRVVDPPRVLEHTWKYERGPYDDHVETVVRYDLEERDGVTHVRLTHTGFTDVEARDDHERGWTVVLGWLRAYAE